MIEQFLLTVCLNSSSRCSRHHNTNIKTSNAAEALSNNDVAKLKPGRFADMVAVVGDPSKDVRLLENVAVVIKDEVVLKSAK